MNTGGGLTKIQIILLTLLVSFVTSILTAFITTSLLSEGKPGLQNSVTQIGTRILDKVAPAPNSTK